MPKQYSKVIVERNNEYVIDDNIKKVFYSALADDKTSIEKYLATGGDINIRDRQNRSLLHLIMLKRNFNESLAIWLINQGISLSGTVDIYEEFDAAQYNPLAKSPKDENGQFPKGASLPLVMRASVLHLAYFHKGIQSNIFLMLLADKRIDVNATCDDGPTVVRFERTIYPKVFNERCDAEVSIYNHKALMQLPEDNIVDIDDDFRFTASYVDGYAFEEASLLHYAAYTGELNTLSVLLTRDDLDINLAAKLVRNKHLFQQYDTIDVEDAEDIEDPTDTDETLQRIAYFWICRNAIECYRLFGVSPLHIAFRQANKKFMRELVANNAQLDKKDGLGNYPSDYLAITLFERACIHKLNGILNVAQYKSMTHLLSHLSKNNWPVYQQLILGDGNFSYAAAYAKKHPQIVKSLVVSDYQSHEALQKKHRQAFLDNVDKLKKSGAEVNFGVDARNIPAFKNQRFKRIHFNFPHDGSHRDAGTLPKLLYDFFSSAAKVQKEKDVIYMVLPHDLDEDRQKFREGYIYNIFEVSAKNGYIRERKRAFRKPGKERYDGYEHVKTKNGDKNTNISSWAYEHIFVKTKLSYDEILNSQYGPEVYNTVYHGQQLDLYYLRNIDIDPQSSDEEDLKSLSSDDEFDNTTAMVVFNGGNKGIKKN